MPRVCEMMVIVGRFVDGLKAAGRGVLRRRAGDVSMRMPQYGQGRLSHQLYQ